MGAQIPTQIAMGIGAAGALVDVSSYVAFEYGIQFQRGRQDEFRATPPSTFSFTLNNQDGRFTPNSVASPLATTVTEGMQVTWLEGARLVAGTIRGIQFPGSESDWGHVTIACDDMLGNASRRNLTSLSESIALGAQPYMYWPMDEAASVPGGNEKSGNLQPNLSLLSDGSAVFGVAGLAVLGGSTQLQLQPSPVSGGAVLATSGTIATIPYSTNSMGSWGFWAEPVTAGAGCALVWGLNGLSSKSTFNLGVDPTNGFYAKLGNAVISSALPVVPGVGHYLSLVVTNSGSTSISGSFYVDGSLQGSAAFIPFGADPAGLSTNAQRTPANSVLLVLSAGTFNVAHVSHTAMQANEYLAAPTTEANRYMGIDQTAAELTIGTLPTDLSTAVLDYQPNGGSALDALNEINEGEQGYLSTTVTGTLLAPTQVISVRARTRPTTVSYTFDAQAEVLGVPQFVRDITNMVSAFTVSSPSSSVLVFDSTVVPRVGSANSSGSVFLQSYVDQLGYGQDRLIRGKNVALRVASVTIDTLLTTPDRSADLLAMALGDRIQISNLPTASTLGFTTYDGWLIGVSENHVGGFSSTESFTLYLSPVLPPTGVYNTDLYVNGGNNTISTTLTNVAASMKCTSADVVTLFETSAVNYYLQVDSEVVKVTACSAPVAGVQTLTITRAQFSTAAAAHAIGVVPEVYADSTGRLNNGTHAF